MKLHRPIFFKHFFLSIFLICITSFFVNAQSVGIGTKTPDASAMLDITSLNKGLLVPRIQSLTSTKDDVTIPNAATSLLIYTSINGQDEGYYYNSSAIAGNPFWTRLSTSTLSAIWELSV